MTEIEQQLERARMKTAFAAINVAVRQLSQVARCLTIAQLAQMSGDAGTATSELAEVNDRLEEVGKHLLQMVKVVEDLGDAS